MIISNLSKFINLFSILLCFLFLFPLKNIFSVNLSSLPQWFFNPSPGQTKGIIGIAINHSLDKITPIESAKINALESLTQLLPQFEVSYKKQFELIDNKIASIAYKDRIIYFKNQFKLQHYTLVYLVIEPKNTIKNSNHNHHRQCQPEICSPQWLCHPVTKDHVGFLGISYNSINFKRRLYNAQKNALKVMEYSLGVRVKGKQTFFDYKNSINQIQIQHESFSVIKKKTNQLITFYTKAQCYKNETLFTWQVSDDLPYFEAAKDITWLHNPLKNETQGVIGFAPKGYSELFSIQFNRAIEHGINELSKNVKINIKSTYESNNNNFFQKNEMQHDNSIHPRLLGIYLDEKNRFFTWLTLFKKE